MIKFAKIMNFYYFKIMNKLKISIVSYSNSLPFVFGLENFLDKKYFSLHSDIPSVCAEKLINKKVEIALIPVASLKKIKNYNLISNFCIASHKKVFSVLLLSERPLKEIKNIYLDYQSQSSINLVKILSREFWKIKVKFLNAKFGYESKIKSDTAGVVIGDRTFSMMKKYPFVYDLSEEWHKYTNLPFVFAVWVSNVKLENEFIKKFNYALHNGIKNIKNHKNLYIKNYLQKYISYNLDKEKIKAMNLFLSKIINK